MKGANKVALSKLVKELVKGSAKKAAPKAATPTVQGDLFEAMAKSPEAAQKELKRIMYTNQERTGTIGGEFRVFEGLEELPTGGKRPIQGDDISNLNSPFISIESPAGAKVRGQAELFVDPELSPDIPVGNPVKGAKTVMTNLIDSKGQWKWIKAPEGYEDNTFLVAMKSSNKDFTPTGADHAYTLKTIYEKGGKMATYDTRAKAFRDKSIQESEAMLEEALARLDNPKLKSKARRDLRGDNPRGKPTTTGIPEFGPVVGTIKTAKKEHPVYEYVIMRQEGGSVGRVERNPYGDYQRLI